MIIERVEQLFDKNIDKTLVIEIILQGKGLKTLPDLSGYKNLKILDCSNNLLTVLPPLDSLFCLEELSCRRNKLTVFPALNGLTNLKILDCNYNLLSVLPSLDSLHHLEELTCKWNELTVFPSLDKLTNLKILDCCSNELLVFPPFDSLIHLKKLHCRGNKLTVLPSLDSLHHLKDLDCAWNKLTVLPSLDSLAFLEYFDCSRNNLHTLPRLDSLVRLISLTCCHSGLISLPSLDSLIHLEYLYCPRNFLVSLPPLDSLLNLKILSCKENRLTGLPQSLLALRNLRSLIYSDNMLEIPPNIARFIDRLNNTGTHGNVYTDSQGVHRSSVVSSVKKSIENLMTDKIFFSESEILQKSAEYKLDIGNFYSDEEVLHSVLVTWKDIYNRVFSRILRSDHREELIKILRERLLDCVGVCLTGKITQLITVLIGFFEDINIEVSDNERISAIVLEVQRSSVANKRTETRKRLIAAGYSEVMNVWINEIDEASEIIEPLDPE